VTLYDSIGRSYAGIRRPDPRLAERIWRALGDARSVVNVGAGAGSYEPPDRDVTAVEPSEVMIAQRSPEAAPVVQATAESLPFPDDSFDAAMAVLTVHHWEDLERGLDELRRVARDRVVVVSYDPKLEGDLWIVRDYLPEVAADFEQWLPSIDRLVAALGPATVETLSVPNDCTDRMFATLWARPEDYLDPAVRAATSVWHALPPDLSERALRALADDLASGAWDARHGHLRAEPEWDVGLRLISYTSPPARGPSSYEQDH
jgi:SAM-dependent methyltransferase